MVPLHEWCSGCQWLSGKTVTDFGAFMEIAVTHAAALVHAGETCLPPGSAPVPQTVGSTW